jgi:ATP-dependent protease HslVU (ClpYQ) peptidase subunit
MKINIDERIYDDLGGSKLTCIVGVLDKEQDCVYVGAYSLGSYWSKQAIFKNRKVFKAKDNSNVLMAICGDYKLQNILSIEENLIEEVKHLKNEVNFEYLVKYTAPKIMDLANKYYCITNKDGYRNLEGSLIFAYKNQLYVIESNGQVLEPADNYIAGGSGDSFATAVLSQNKDKITNERIKEALEAAEKHGLGIKRPFYIMNTKNDEVITIE